MRGWAWALAAGLAACVGTAGIDEDADGWSAVTGDCDDGDALVYPGRDEVPYDGIDQDCDGADLDDLDADAYAGCAEGACDDCDDLDPHAHPDAAERCGDAIDQDCDGADLPCAPDDHDADGFGSTHGDCDDDDDAIFPGAHEIPYDGVDQDCSGGDLVDVDGDGVRPGDGDCDDLDPRAHAGAVEVFHDGIDEDCDPATDDADADADGHDAADLGGDDCDDFDPDASPSEEEVPYDGVDQDCDPATPDDDLDGDGFFEVGDCDDEDAATHPGAVDIPYDDVDQDCVQGDLVDVDGDGFDADDDCADLDPDAFPGGTEVPYDGADQDCDGSDEWPSVPVQGLACAWPITPWTATGGGVSLAVATCGTQGMQPVYGAFVDSDGAFGEWFPVVQPSSLTSAPPIVVWNGESFVVLGVVATSLTTQAVVGATVQPNGNVGATVAITGDAPSWKFGEVVAGGGETLVQLGTSLRLLDHALGPIASLSAPVPSEGHVALAASEDRFLVAWAASNGLRRVLYDHAGGVPSAAAAFGAPSEGDPEVVLELPGYSVGMGVVGDPSWLRRDNRIVPFLR